MQHFTDYFLQIQPNISLRAFRPTTRHFGLPASHFSETVLSIPARKPIKLLVAFNSLSLAMYSSFSCGLLHPSCPYVPTRCRSKCRGGSCRPTVRWNRDRCVIDLCVRQKSTTDEFGPKENKTTRSPSSLGMYVRTYLATLDFGLVCRSMRY